MEKENRNSKSFYVGVLFLGLVAVAVATDTLMQIGMGHNYVYILSLSFLVSLLLFRTGPLTVLLVLIGLAAANLPDRILLDYGVDRDLLLALVCAMILSPSVYNLIVK